VKSKKAFLPKIPFFLTTFLFVALMVGWQVSPCAAAIEKFGDNTGDDYPGTVEDAAIVSDSGATDYNYGSFPTLHVGTVTAGYTSIRRSFIRFKDIASSIGSGQVIASATMYLYCDQEQSTTDYTVSAYRVLLDWGEGNSSAVPEVGAVCTSDAQYDGDVDGIPWNAFGCSAASNDTGEDSTADRRATPEAGTSITGTGWFAWDLTVAVQKWYSGEWSEYGLVLISNDEGAPNSLKRFGSSENVNDGYRPYLEVRYHTEGAALEVCGTGCDYTTIPAALADATAGETVKVTDSRTYSEKVWMKDGVDVVAAVGETPSIEEYTLIYSGMVVFAGPMTCNLRGFTIRYGSMNSGVFVDGSSGQVNATIDNCTMLSGVAMGSGIRLRGAVSVTITGCNIYQGTGAMKLGIGCSGFPGIIPKDRIASDSSITIKGTTVGGSSGEGVGGAGIRLMGADASSNIRVTIGGGGVGDANTVSWNGFDQGAGIVLTDIDKVSIEGNEISDNYRGGILLYNVTTVSPHIRNNDIHDNGIVTDLGAGINIGGASNITIGDDNDIYSNDRAGIAFYVAENNSLGGQMDPILNPTASSQPVTITGNNISSNTKAGIAVIDNVTGTIYIDDNKIYQNTKAGIAIFNECTAEITDNEIYTHTGAAGIFTGDWSGTFGLHAGTGFYRDNGPANLTIQRNKVYGNRAGMRLDHASGTITNNLVYNNSRGGIRFSGNSAGSAPFPVAFDPWGITVIENNTVDDNGSFVAEFSEDRGGGIVYDDINAAHTNFYDPPVGATQNPITIKNNIVANNVKAGIGVCFTNTVDSEERDYNLLYSNNGTGETDCGWPDSINMRCANKNFGGCGGKWNLPGPPKILPDGPNNNIGDPLFVNIAPGNEDYHLQAGSPAENAGDDNLDMGAYGGTDPITW
jgi:parallel beta-helix repeat protein